MALPDQIHRQHYGWLFTNSTARSNTDSTVAGASSPSHEAGSSSSDGARLAVDDIELDVDDTELDVDCRLMI